MMGCTPHRPPHWGRRDDRDQEGKVSLGPQLGDLGEGGQNRVRHDARIDTCGANGRVCTTNEPPPGRGFPRGGQEGGTQGGQSVSKPCKIPTLAPPLMNFPGVIMPGRPMVRPKGTRDLPIGTNSLGEGITWGSLLALRQQGLGRPGEALPQSDPLDTPLPTRHELNGANGKVCSHHGHPHWGHEHDRVWEVHHVRCPIGNCTCVCPKGLPDISPHQAPPQVRLPTRNAACGASMLVHGD